MDYNKWVVVGKVKGQPTITDHIGKKQVAMILIVNDRSPNASGQWVDRLMNVPIYGFEKKAELIEQYVVPGQELLLECKYQNWESEGQKHHGFIILNVIFGFKPRVDNAAGGGAGQAPADGPPM